MNKSLRNILFTLKPGVPRRALLFIAGAVWLLAGGMLLRRGGMALLQNRDYPLWTLAGSLLAGALFYRFVFDKISKKHSSRILKMEEERPCLFSFFNFRSYLMMALMISLGITLRKTGILTAKHLAPLYITMGIPLAVSALRFFWFGINFKKHKT